MTDTTVRKNVMKPGVRQTPIEYETRPDGLWVLRVSDVDGRMYAYTIKGLTEDMLLAWCLHGALIQDVMPNVHRADREFLISGVTPAEWDRIFKRGED